MKGRAQLETGNAARLFATQACHVFMTGRLTVAFAKSVASW